MAQETTPTNPEQKPAETPPTPAPTPTPDPAPAPAEVKLPDGLTPEQKAAFEVMQNAVKQAQAAAASAKAKADEPWYWNDFSKGVYVGAGVVLLAVGGVYLYNKYTSDAEA